MVGFKTYSPSLFSAETKKELGEFVRRDAWSEKDTVIEQFKNTDSTKLLQYANRGPAFKVLAQRQTTQNTGHALSGIQNRPKVPGILMAALLSIVPNIEKTHVLFQVQILEIPKGGGLSAHTDPPRMGDRIFTINMDKASLTLAPIKTLAVNGVVAGEDYTHPLKEFEVYELTGNALTLCTHAIKNSSKDKPRYSITFRCYKNECCQLLLRQAQSNVAPLEKPKVGEKCYAFYMKDDTANPSKSYASAYPVEVKGEGRKKGYYEVEFEAETKDASKNRQHVPREYILLKNDPWIPLNTGRLTGAPLFKPLEEDKPIPTEPWMKGPEADARHFGIAFLLNFVNNGPRQPGDDRINFRSPTAESLFPCSYWFELRNKLVEHDALIQTIRDKIFEMKQEMKHDKKKLTSTESSEWNNLYYKEMYDDLLELANKKTKRKRTQVLEEEHGLIVSLYPNVQIADSC